jgi:hypothetical protein
MKNLTQDSWCPNQDFNSSPPKYNEKHYHSSHPAWSLSYMGRQIMTYGPKVCDDGILIQLSSFWILSVVLVFLFKTQRFRDWILSVCPHRLGPTE